MSNLIEELKQEHVAIANTLQTVKTLGIHTEEARQLLAAAKSGLLAHIKKEDEQLYTELRRAARTDPNLQQTLDTFAKDMDDVSKGVLRFFEKYANGGSGLEFAKDFGRLYAELTMRIYKEENILYKRYEKLKGLAA